MSSNDEYEGRSQRTRASPACAGHAWSCTAAARARRDTASAAAAGRLSAAETGSSSRLLVPGRRGAVVGQEVRRERRLDEVGPPLVRLVEQRRDAGLDLVAAAFQREDVRRREPEAARSIRHRRARRRPPRSRRSATQAARRTARSAGSTHTRCRAHVRSRARRRLPRMMVRADLAVAARLRARAAHPPIAASVATGYVMT